MKNLIPYSYHWHQLYYFGISFAFSDPSLVMTFSLLSSMVPSICLEVRLCGWMLILMSGLFWKRNFWTESSSLAVLLWMGKSTWLVRERLTKFLQTWFYWTLTQTLVLKWMMQFHALSPSEAVSQSACWTDESWQISQDSVVICYFNNNIILLRSSCYFTIFFLYIISFICMISKYQKLFQ